MENPNAKMRICSEIEVTVDFVVNEGNAIWAEFKRRKIDIQNDVATQELLDWARDKHPKFYSSYPIVCRYICQLGEYREKALRWWITKVKESPWKTEAEYLDAQTDYVCILYSQIKPRANLTDKRNLRTNIRNMLQREHEQFKQIGQEAVDEVNRQQAAAKKQVAAELREFVSTNDMSDVGTVRVINDESLNDVHIGQNSGSGSNIYVGMSSLDDHFRDRRKKSDHKNKTKLRPEICADDLLG